MLVWNMISQGVDSAEVSLTASHWAVREPDDGLVNHVVRQGVQKIGPNEPFTTGYVQEITYSVMV